MHVHRLEDQLREKIQYLASQLFGGGLRSFEALECIIKRKHPATWRDLSARHARQTTLQGWTSVDRTDVLMSWLYPPKASSQSATPGSAIGVTSGPGDADRLGLPVNLLAWEPDKAPGAAAGKGESIAAHDKGDTTRCCYTQFSELPAAPMMLAEGLHLGWLLSHHSEMRNFISSLGLETSNTAFFKRCQVMRRGFEHDSM